MYQARNHLMAILYPDLHNPFLMHLHFHSFREQIQCHWWEANVNVGRDLR